MNDSETARNPDDPFAALERETLADQLQAQRDVLELENWFLRRLMYAQPGLVVVNLAGGALAAGGLPLARDTIPGDERDVWSGVYVENPGPAAVAIGFSAGGSIGAGGYLVPANTWKVIPVRYVSLGVGLVDETQLQGPAVRVTIARLRVPPMGPSSGPLSSLSMGGIEDTVSAAGSAGPAPGAGAVIASVAVPPGLYRVDTVTYEPTTPDGVLANARLTAGGVAKGPVPTTATPLQTTWPRVTVLPVTPTITLTVIAPAGAGAIYYGALTATRLS